MKATSDWKTYALGLLFSAVAAMSGITYTSAMDRVEKVETAVAEHDKLDKNTAVQLAVLQTSIQELKNDVGSMSANQEHLVSKMDALVSNMLKDSQRWNSLIDQIERERSKQNEKR